MDKNEEQKDVGVTMKEQTSDEEVIENVIEVEDVVIEEVDIDEDRK